MPAPSNQTPATALPIGLDYSITIPDLDLATPAPNCDLWWSYTAASGDTVVGFWAGEYVSASYNPVTTVWTGPIGSLVSYLGIGASNVPVQIPVAVGTTYYFRVRNSSGMTPAAGVSVAISALRAPAVIAPVGSILINDDAPDFPAVLISGADGSVLQFKVPVVAGEAGDVLPTGEILLENGYATPNSTLVLYSAQLVEVLVTAYVPNNFGTIRVRTHIPSGKWYVGDSGAGGTPASATTIDADGALGPDTWTFPVAGLTGMAANADESILYFSGQAGSINSPIERWDLPGDAALSDLVAGVADYATGDILVLPDDTIVVLYFRSATTDLLIRRYSTAGATLNTYAIGAVSSVLPRLASSTTAGNFWVMYQDGTDDEVHHFDEIVASSGATATALTGTVYEGGTYQGTPTATPQARFGESFSCPFMVLRVAIDGEETPEPTPPGVYTLVPHTRRRVRVFSPLSEEMVRAFHKSLLVDVETGVGVNDDDAQGYDPQIMLRHSDDGAHTWSSVKTRSLGKQGEYSKLVRYGPLGMARQRTYELSTSEPVRTNLIGGYLDAEAGTGT